MNDDKKKALAEIELIASGLATTLGLEIVEFVFHSQGKHSLLRIDVDRPGMPGVALADCEAMSRALGDRIEDLPFFAASYDLQVSSPGVDRPIRTDDDLRRNAGRPVRIEFQDENGKARELRGTLGIPRGLGDVTIERADGETRIARDRILVIKQDVSVGGRKRKNA